MSLADRIKVRTCYTRSTNVERDSGTVATVAAYHPTTRGVALLKDVAAAFGQGNQPRAWSLIGPYGTGKSTFGVFLHALLGANDGTATEAAKVLGKQSRHLATRFRRQKPWCRVVLAGSPEPLSRRLLTALDAAASAFWQGRPGRKPRVLRDIHNAATGQTVPESRILALIDALQDALERVGAGGLLFVMDELGKFLEFEARQPAGHMGSTYLLQELAERTYLGRKANLMLFVLQHQTFDMYAPGAGELQNEWAKVQGRFQTVSFIETTEQTLRVLSAAFEHDFTQREQSAIRRCSRQCATALANANALPLGLKANAAAELFTACYPMHPVALLVLPVLCVRFAQNERTLFSYFGSQEPHGFQQAAKRLRRFGEHVPPGEVYDYFIQAQPPAFATPLAQRTWAEVVTAVDRAGREERKRANGADDQAARFVALAKAVGLLNLTTGNDAIPASEAVLRQLDATDGLQEAITASVDASILQYRKFADEYRVWQGTDFNIDEHIARERDKLGRVDLARVMTERGETAPIVARRHSIETGALRAFEIVYADAEHRAPSEGRGHKPRLVFFLAENRADEAAFRQARKSAQASEVWVLHRGGAALRSAIVQVLALERVRNNFPESEVDAVAVLEVEIYLRRAKAAEQQALSALFRDPSASAWYWQGDQFDTPDRRTLQSVLSDIMDGVYWASPKVRQELINRDGLSPQAVAARNKLLQCMFDSADQATLGISGYPLEKAMYHAVLERGELHGQDKAGNWILKRPTNTDLLNLGPALQRLDMLFETSETDPVSAQQLMDELAAPPFGVKHGLFWILLMHYYLLNRNEIALFDEHGYSPVLTYEAMRRMFVRPAHATFRHFRPQGTRTLLFDEYSTALFGRSRGSLSTLDIARPLIRFVLGLDDYSLKTKRVSETAVRVRQAIRTSKSAQQLVFHDLGNACGLSEGAEWGKLANTVAQALRELANARKTLLDDMRTAVCECFGAAASADLRELRDAARSQCEELPQYQCVDGFKPFIAAAGAKGKPDDEWFEDLLAVLGDEPSTGWDDGVETVVKAKLVVYAESLRDWQLLKSSEATCTAGPTGPAGQHEAVELILLSLKRAGRDTVRIVAQCDTAPSNQFVESVDAVKKVIESVDEKYRLALVAGVVEDHIGGIENVH